MNINELINMKKSWDYDFKDEKGYTGDVIDKFINYRKNEGIFDADGSGEKNEKYLCKLSRDIYRKLWNFDDIIGKVRGQDSYNVKRYGMTDFDLNLQMGPDTINTFLCLLKDVYSNFHNVVKYSNKGILTILYNHNFTVETLKEINLKTDLICNGDILDYCKSLSNIGNFVLVPKYFNSDRGCSFIMKDYFDISLFCLKSFGYKKKDVLFKTENFTKFINYFYLWDYTVMDKNDYKVKSLFSKDYYSNPNLIDDECDSRINIEMFCKNATMNIKRRGIFMIALLDLENSNHEEFLNFRKKIADNIFNTLDDALKEIICLINNDYLIKTIKDKVIGVR